MMTTPTGLFDEVTEALLYADQCKEYLPAYKAFTLNPDPTKYPTTDPRGQYETILNCLLLKKEITKIFSKFFFTPELTENGNIHIHGYFSIKDQVKYYRWFIPACKAWGFLVIKSNIDEKWMMNYCCKDIALMTQVLGNDIPIPLTEENFAMYNDQKDIKKMALKIVLHKTKHKPNLKKKITDYFN